MSALHCLLSVSTSVCCLFLNCACA